MTAFIDISTGKRMALSGPIGSGHPSRSESGHPEMAVCAAADRIDLCHRIIFDTLHMFLWYGHDNPEEAVILDPPSDFFRTRLIYGLLRTCGMFFAKGTAASRLDRFLVFFQRYLLSKEPAPLDVTFELQVRQLARVCCRTACIIIFVKPNCYSCRVPGQSP